MVGPARAPSQLSPCAFVPDDSMVNAAHHGNGQWKRAAHSSSRWAALFNPSVILRRLQRWRVFVGTTHSWRRLRRGLRDTPVVLVPSIHARLIRECVDIA